MNDPRPPIGLLKKPAPRLYSMREAEAQYRAFASEAVDRSLDLSRWLPSLGTYVRPLVPGELVGIIADTGVGKSAALQNIAGCVKDEEGIVIYFSLELPLTLMYERFMQMANRLSGTEVLETYQKGGRLDWGRFRNVYICPESRICPLEIEAIVKDAPTLTGRVPLVVFIDYLQLLTGKGGSRYERISDIAEQMKIVAKQTNTILILASQVCRPENKRGNNEVFLHDAKDSGSIESSCGLLLGLWREGEDGEVLKVKILKNTKARGGKIFECRYTGHNLNISEPSPIDDDDLNRCRQMAVSEDN